MSSPPAQPPVHPPTHLGRLVQVVGSILLGAGVAAAVIYLAGVILFDSPVLLALCALLALAVIVFGAAASLLPVMPVYLTGEADQWHVRLGWDGRVIGFLPSGVRFIKPVQKVKPWVRVGPVIVTHDFHAYNASRDPFDLHLKLMFRVNPQLAQGANARWLFDSYKDGLIGTVKGMAEDLLTRELRAIHSFTQIADERTVEQLFQEALNGHYTFLEAKGVVIAPEQTFVDIMIPKELLAKRTSVRADLAELQVIRDTAHELEIPVTELLVQQVLGKLTGMHRAGGISRREVVEALELLGRLQPSQPQPRAPLPAPDIATKPTQEAPAVKPEGQSPSAASDQAEKPASYIEGQYRYSDGQHPNDPDGDTPRPGKFVSPF